MLFDLHYKWSIEVMIDWLIDWSAQSKDMIVRITVFFLIWQIPNKRLFGNVEGSNLSSTDRDTTVEHTVYKIFLIIMYVAMLCMNLPILNVADDMSDSEHIKQRLKCYTLWPGICSAFMPTICISKENLGLS